jgi:uncharacterized membrane protein YedE/YeeE
MDEGLNLWLIGSALAIGLAFGALLQRSRLCLVSAVSNLAIIRDSRQLQGFLALWVVAILGTLALESGGWVAVGESAYRGARLDWLTVSLGGSLFGFGSLLAGGCAGRTVVRAAEGHLGALITLVGFAFAATATLYGVLEPARIWLLEHTAVDLLSGDGGLGAVLGLPPWVPALVLSGACLAFLGFLPSGRNLILPGALLGLLIVAGWWATGYLAYDEWNPHPPNSVGIAGPLARGTVLLTSPVNLALDFGVPLIVAILTGAFLSALIGRQFHWVPPQPAHVGSHIVGGVLMGVGAILAGGCNVGNGMTGVSALSCRSFLALATIVLGMLAGLLWLHRREGLRHA